MTSKAEKSVEPKSAVPSFSERLSLAWGDDTPSDVLAILALDVEWKIRMGVAANVRAPVGALNRLATDESESVRWWVARHRRTPQQTLARLSRDDSERVRSAALARFGAGEAQGEPPAGIPVLTAAQPGA